MQRTVLEQLLPDDEAILLLDKSLLEVVKRYQRKDSPTKDAHDLDDQFKSDFIGGRWSVEEEKTPSGRSRDGEPFLPI